MLSSSASCSRDVGPKIQWPGIHLGHHQRRRFLLAPADAQAPKPGGVPGFGVRGEPSGPGPPPGSSRTDRMSLYPLLRHAWSASTRTRQRRSPGSPALGRCPTRRRSCSRSGRTCSSTTARRSTPRPCGTTSCAHAPARDPTARGRRGRTIRGGVAEHAGAIRRRSARCHRRGRSSRPASDARARLPGGGFRAAGWRTSRWTTPVWWSTTAPRTGSRWRRATLASTNGRPEASDVHCRVLFEDLLEVRDEPRRAMEA